MESRVDSISKELMSTRPNPKVYINPKSQPKKNINTNPKADEELRKQNKLYEYELKKKINEHSYLCKLLKTKNTSDLSHLDIYSEMNKLS